MKVLWALMGLLTAASPEIAVAARTVLVAPLRIHSTHAGVKSGVGCVHTDFVVPTGLTYSDSGVTGMKHTVDFDFKNLSGRDQPVEVILLKGSNIQARLYDQNGPFPPAYSLSWSADTSVSRFTVPANSAANLNLWIGCNLTGCTIKKSVDGGAAAPFDGHAGTDIEVGTQYQCGNMQTNFQFKFVIDDDRGALVGNISTSAHRANGYKNNFVSLPFISINGGRPF